MEGSAGRDERPDRPGRAGHREPPVEHPPGLQRDVVRLVLAVHHRDDQPPVPLLGGPDERVVRRVGEPVLPAERARVVVEQLVVVRELERVVLRALRRDRAPRPGRVPAEVGPGQRRPRDQREVVRGGAADAARPARTASQRGCRTPAGAWPRRSSPRPCSGPTPRPGPARWPRRCRRPSASTGTAGRSCSAHWRRGRPGCRRRPRRRRWPRSSCAGPGTSAAASARSATSGCWPAGSGRARCGRPARRRCPGPRPPRPGR